MEIKTIKIGDVEIKQTAALAPMAYIIGETVGSRYNGKVSADEIGLPVETGSYALPCGSTAMFTAENI